MRKLFTLLAAIVLFCGQLAAQGNRTVKGKVTDDKGLPLQGVTVSAVGTNKKVATDKDGNFAIEITSKVRSLQFTYVGFALQEVSVTDASVVDVKISLKAEDASLTEVVVVGYGTQQRRQVSAAIGSIDPTPIATLVTPSIDKQLGGRTPGVQVTNPSGLVNQPPRIRVRGTNSVSGSSDPLIVVDGIPLASGGYAGYTNDNLLATINPADVESIEVLKDGSATAIYGSRASNGVILINTKKGKSGRFNANFNSTFGQAKVIQKFDLLNAQEFVTIANEKLTNAGQAAGAFMNAEGTNTDWQDVVFQDANFMNHNFSMDGGTDKTTYFFSLNYTDQQGVVKTNFLKRYGIRANIDQRVNKWLKISNYITLSRTYDSDQNNGGNALSGATAGMLRALPNVRVMNPAMTNYYGYNVTPDGAALGQDANTRIIENNYTNIAYVLDKNKFRSTKHRIINNFGIEIKPVNWLTYNFKANVDYITLDEYLSYDARHGDGRNSLGRVQNQAANSVEWVLQNYINANKTFNGHGVGLTLGYENQNRRGNSFQSIGLNLSDPFFQQTNVISGSYVTQQSSGSYGEGPGFVAYFARLNYDYKGKYIISGTFRRDGLSRFAPEKRFGNFPGASVAYRISQEKFFENAGLGKIFNDVKFRASWATVGNQAIAGGGFPYLSLYAAAPYGALSGIAASQAGNTDLEWEQNEKLNVGGDFTLWNNRINVVFDWYKNKNNQLVFAVPQPPSLGIPGNVIFQNIGAMENTGFEFSVNATLIQKKDFSLDLGFNLTTQKNKILSLPGGQDIIVSNGTGNYNILRQGESFNSLYGYRFAGVNSNNGNPVYVKADGSLVMGNITNSSYFAVTDVNATATGAASNLAGSDRVILGNTLPTYFGGATLGVNYKGFSLDMLWRYSGGNKIMNITKQETLLNQGFMNNGRDILNRWTKVGDVTTVPRLWYNRDNFTNLNQQAVDRFVEDGDFVRLDNLQISYQVPSARLQKLTNSYVKSFRVFVQGQNLVVFTNYSGIDPDNIDVRGLDYNTLPQTRSLSFGFNLGF